MAVALDALAVVFDEGRVLVKGVVKAHDCGRHTGKAGGLGCPPAAVTRDDGAVLKDREWLEDAVLCDAGSQLEVDRFVSVDGQA